MFHEVEVSGATSFREWSSREGRAGERGCLTQAHSS